MNKFRFGVAFAILIFATSMAAFFVSGSVIAGILIAGATAVLCKDIYQQILNILEAPQKDPAVH